MKRACQLCEQAGEQYPDCPYCEVLNDDNFWARRFVDAGADITRFEKGTAGENVHRNVLEARRFE